MLKVMEHAFIARAEVVRFLPFSAASDYIVAFDRGKILSIDPTTFSMRRLRFPDVKFEPDTMGWGA